MLKYVRRLLAVLLLGASSLVLALPAPCVVDTLANYVALGATGCSLANGHATDFQAPLPGQTGFNAIDAATISVIPGTNVLFPGFTFALNLSTADRLESFFHFSYLGTNVVSQHLSMTGSAQSDDGSVSVVVDMCGDGRFDPLQPSNCIGSLLAPLITLHTATDLIPTAQNSFTPGSFFDVFVDISLDGPGGLGLGTATLGTVNVQFAAVPDLATIPEPATIPLVLIALLVLSVARHRDPYTH